MLDYWDIWDGKIFLFTEGIMEFKNFVRSVNVGKKSFIVLCMGDIRNLMLLNWKCLRSDWTMVAV